VGYPIWLLRLVIPGPFGRLLTGTLLFIGMFALFLLGADDRSISGSAALFLSAITAYIVPVFSYIIKISVRAVSDLEELLQLPRAEFLQVRSSISCRPAWWNAMVCVLGVIGGSFHLYILRGGLTDAWRLGLEDRGELLEIIGTLIVWIVMTTTIYALVENGVNIGLLGKRLRPFNLFRTHRLLPFARVAIASTLSIVGSLALFPLQSIDQDITLVTAAPGLVAASAPLVALLLFPVWHVHQAIRTRKAAELAAIDERVAALGDIPHGGREEQIRACNELLDYRDHVQRVPDWPVDVGAVSRLLLYLIIPPLTWVGAALIENVVDRLV
jgi:hypothetical protein